jgi:hypothetical protein
MISHELVVIIFIIREMHLVVAFWKQSRWRLGHFLLRDPGLKELL